jgi:TP901 family phage tail tape measure protein
MATLTSKLIVSLLDRVSGPAKGIGASLDRLNRRATRMNGALLAGGAGMVGGSVRNLLAVGAGYVGVTKGIGGTVGAAIKFEEAFADVRKVVDGTPAQLSVIRSEILAMSKTLPVTAEGIAAIYAAAGQSNIPINELGKFSEMTAKVAVAWEMVEGETSDSLAKIKNQLNMNVDQIGLHADAINELGNNTAANARDLVDFDKRVAANGKMFGFSATQTLAFGGAMISTGAQSEVAATSFRNMGRALTIGARATKMQRTAFGRLGLDSIKTAKAMQKNALNTTLDVLDRIQKLPEWERISIASALFGDEARALMPVINNTSELRRQIALVANETEYAGSAFEEYMVRAETSANALQILWNKIRGVGIGIGDSWLPTIKEFSLGVGDVLDTLNKRVGVIDQIKASFTGFMGGIGYGGTGGVRELMNDLGDLLFGEAFGGSLKDADERVVGLARLSNRFREIGTNIRSFVDNVAGGNFGQAAASLRDALSNMSGGLTVTGALALGVVGWGLKGIAGGALALARSPIGQIAIAATAVAALIDAAQGAETIGEFVDNLSRLSALEWAGIGAGLLLIAARAKRVYDWFRMIRTVTPELPGAAKPGVPNPSAASPSGPKISPSAASSATSILGRGAITAIATVVGEWLINKGFQAAGKDTNTPGTAENAANLWESLKALLPSDLTKPIGATTNGAPADVNLIGVPEVSIPAPVTTQPSGVQDVRVTNPPPAPNVYVTVHAQTNADPGQIAAATEAALSAKLNALSRGSFSD